MKFKYKKLTANLFRPVIPIDIQYADQKVRFEVLVDSGADINIVNAEIADILGIDVKSGKPGTVRGVTGKPETFYTHEVDIIVGGHATTVEMAFAESVGSDGYGIVGQKGFFDVYKIKFDYRKQEIEIVPY